MGIVPLNESFLNSEEFMQPMVCEFTKDGLTYNKRKQYIEPAIYTVYITRYFGYLPSVCKLLIFTIIIKNKIYSHSSKKIIGFLFLECISHTSE